MLLSLYIPQIRAVSFPICNNWLAISLGLDVLTPCKLVNSYNSYSDITLASSIVVVGFSLTSGFLISLSYKLIYNLGPRKTAFALNNLGEVKHVSTALPPSFFFTTIGSESIPNLKYAKSDFF